MKKLYSLLLASSLVATSTFAALDNPITTDITITKDTPEADRTSSANILVNSGGSIEITNNGVLSLSATGGYTLKLESQSKSTLKISDGGSLICSHNVNGSLWLDNTTSATIAADAGDITMEKLVISAGTLNLHKENALRDMNGNATNIMIINSSSVLKATASQELGKWDIRSSAKFIFGDVGDNTSVKLTFIGITTGATNETVMDRKITLENFGLNDFIYFEDITTISDFKNNQITMIDYGSKNADGELGKKAFYTFTGMSEDLVLVKDSDLGLSTNGATLMLASAAAAVPEPAEWATIFGALALGLAIYRKRK